MQPSAAKGMGSARRPLEACSAESPSTGSASRGWGRAFGLGPRRAAAAILCAVVLAGVGALVLVTRGSHGGSIAAGRHTAAPGALKYGGLPSWLSASSFFFTDEQGKLHHPSMSALGGGAPPTQVTRGRSVSVKLHDILPTGEGALSWAPRGPRAIATWDYTVEID